MNLKNNAVSKTVTRTSSSKKLDIVQWLRQMGVADHLKKFHATKILPQEVLAINFHNFLRKRLQFSSFHRNRADGQYLEVITRPAANSAVLVMCQTNIECIIQQRLRTRKKLTCSDDKYQF